MLTRDPLWADMLETSYSSWSNRVFPRSGVHRLIDAARRADLGALPEDVGTLWAVTLAWFCSSPDRRIRDRATMAMVSLFRARPAVLVSLLCKFAESDDQYIAERVVVASYGALLLHPSPPHLRDAAREVYNRYFAEGEPPLNASLRDHARLIIELAVDLDVAPPRLRRDRYRPPYSSAWPIRLPSEEDVKPFANDRERFPRMPLGQLGSDFARYIVEPKVVDAFNIAEAGLSKFGLLRWFLQKRSSLVIPAPRTTARSLTGNCWGPLAPVVASPDGRRGLAKNIIGYSCANSWGSSPTTSAREIGSPGKAAPSLITCRGLICVILTPLIFECLQVISLRMSFG